MKEFIKLFYQNLNPLQIITKNSFWLISGKILSGILRALLVIFSARILGPQAYGNFSLAMNFVLIFSFLPEFGLTSILTRELSKNVTKEEKYKTFNCIFSISLFLSFISYFLIFLIGFLVISNPISLKLLPILGLMMIFDIFREMIYSIYRSQLRGDLQGIFHFLTNIFLFFIGFFILTQNPTEIYLAWGYLIAITLGFLLSTIMAFDYLKKFRPYVNWELYKNYLNSSWPIALGTSLYLLLLFTDSIILSWYHPAFVVGLYNSAVKVNEFLVLIPTGIALAVLPIFVQSLNNKEEIKRQIEFSLYLIYLTTLPIILGIFVLSKSFIALIFGKEYFLAHYGLKILIPSLLGQSIFMIFSQFLIAIDRRKELLIYEGFGFFLNLILNLIFIPRFSYLAAAFNTTISSYLVLLFAVLSIKRYVKFNLFNGFNIPLFASLLMALFIWSLKFYNVIFLIFLAGVFYLILLLVLKDPLIFKIFRMFIAK